MIVGNLSLSGIVASSRQKKSAITGGAHRYWRVLVPISYSLGGTPAVSADSVEMRAVSGGSNLATTAANALSDSEFSGSYLNDYAFDGINNNFWVSQNSNYGTHWIGYDFGAGNEREIQEILWAKRPDFYGRHEAPLVGIVQHSDDAVTWTTYWSFLTPRTWIDSAESRVFTNPNSVKRRWWRVRVVSVQGGSTYPASACEIEFRKNIGGATICTGGYYLATLQNISYPGSNAFDGNLSSSNFWLSIPLTNGQPTIGYILPASEDVNQISWRVRGDSYGANEGITAGVVESSFDGISWGKEWDISTPATWQDNSTETRLFNRP